MEEVNFSATALGVGSWHAFGDCCAWNLKINSGFNCSTSTIELTEWICWVYLMHTSAIIGSPGPLMYTDVMVTETV